MARYRGGIRLMHWLAIALGIVLVDQFTKLLIVGSMQLGGSTPGTTFF